MANVKVAVRVRPLSKKEEESDATNIVDINGDNVLSIRNIKVNSPESAGDRHRERVKQFSFDYCYYSVDRNLPHYASQELIYQDLGTEVLNSSFDGYNVSLFAYGQTGSGKTYTMLGDHDELGMIPRICEGLCSRVDDFEDGVTFKIEVSYLEIYNERVRDLLAEPDDVKYTLKVREHPKEGPYVQDLSKHFVSDYAMISMLLDKGNVNRTTAATHMHDNSSRSHAIFTLNFIQAKLENGMPSEIVSKINLVDLAGSERAKYNYSKDRLQEGANINKSLVTLGNCISALAENSMRLTASNSLESLMSEDGDSNPSTPRSPSPATKKSAFIPYRNSILTWLLRDSLGGNAKTIMIATISPASCNFNESMSTLRYARRAKRIINNAIINEDPNVRLIRELRSEIDRLKQLLNCASLSSSQASLVQDNTISRMLLENEQKIDQLTEAWVDKWREAARIMQECNVGIRRESVGVIVESELPHLIGMDDDLLSTGIILYHIKEGETKIGRSDSNTEQDIVLWGPRIDQRHALVENRFGKVTLTPINGAMCAVNGVDIQGPTALTQGAVILLGKTNMFRFNHPAEAAKLRERRAPRRRNSITFRVPNSLTVLSEEVNKRRVSVGSDGSLLVDSDADNEDLKNASFSSLSLDVSPFMMFNPGLELERQQKIESDKLDHTRKRLKELLEKQQQAEQAHEEREKKMKEAYEEHQKMIQEQKNVLAKLTKDHKTAKQKADEDLAEMKGKLQQEKEKGKRELEEELKDLREDINKRAETAATSSPNFPRVVALNRAESLANLNLSRLDADRKRLTQMELLQKQNHKKAEAALHRRIATFDRQQRAAKCLIEQEEKRLHEIENLPNFDERFDSAGNHEDVFDYSEDIEMEGERAAVIGCGRVSPIGGRSDSDSSSCKGGLIGPSGNTATKGKCNNAKPTHVKQTKTTPKDSRTMRNSNEVAGNKQRTSKQGTKPVQRTPKQSSKNEQRTPKQAPKHEQKTLKQEQVTRKQVPKKEQRTFGRSAEKTPGRSKNGSMGQKSQSVSPAPVSRRRSTRSPSPSTGGVFSRLFPQHKAKFNFLRTKRGEPGDDYDASQERGQDKPPELIRRDISRSESLPPIKLEGKRMSRDTSPKKKSHEGDYGVSAEASTPKADIIRRPVSSSPQPIPSGTAKYPRAKLEHRPRSISPRGPPKCKPEIPNHSAPGKAKPDAATVTTPKMRSKSPNKPSNFDINRTKPKAKSQKEKGDLPLSARPSPKTPRDTHIRAKSCPSSPVVRRKWERPSRVPDLAKVDILFFARKTENAEAYFVGLNPDESKLPLKEFAPRPRSKTLPINCDDSVESEDLKPRSRTNTDPLDSDDVPMLMSPSERLPAVGCSKSMEDMMNAKSVNISHSPESSEVFDDDSLEDSDIDNDSLDEETVSKRPELTPSAIVDNPSPNPSRQNVSPSSNVAPYNDDVEMTIDLVPTYVQLLPQSDDSPKSVNHSGEGSEQQPDLEHLDPSPVTEGTKVTRKPDKRMEVKKEDPENYVKPDNGSNAGTGPDHKTSDSDHSLPEPNSSPSYNKQFPEVDDQVPVQIIRDTFLEKAPIEIKPIQTVMDATLETQNKQLDKPEIPDEFPAMDGPDQTIIDCYLEHHPVASPDEHKDREEAESGILKEKVADKEGNEDITYPEVDKDPIEDHLNTQVEGVTEPLKNHTVIPSKVIADPCELSDEDADPIPSSVPAPAIPPKVIEDPIDISDDDADLVASPMPAPTSLSKVNDQLSDEDVDPVPAPAPVIQLKEDPVELSDEDEDHVATLMPAPAIPYRVIADPVELSDEDIEPVINPMPAPTTLPKVNNNPVEHSDEDPVPSMSAPAIVPKVTEDMIELSDEDIEPVSTPMPTPVIPPKVIKDPIELSDEDENPVPPIPERAILPKVIEDSVELSDEDNEPIPSPITVPTPTKMNMSDKPVQDFELEKDPVITPEPPLSIGDTMDSDDNRMLNTAPEQENGEINRPGGSTMILSAEIEAPDTYTITEVREIKSRPDGDYDRPDEGVRMRLTAQIESPDEWTINEVKEIKSRPTESHPHLSEIIPNGENGTCSQDLGVPSSSDSEPNLSFLPLHIENDNPKPDTPSTIKVSPKVEYDQEDDNQETNITSDSEDGSDVEKAEKPNSPVVMTELNKINPMPDESDRNVPEVIIESVSSDSDDSSDIQVAAETPMATEIREIKSRPDEGVPNVSKIIPEAISTDLESESVVNETLNTKDPLMTAEIKEIKSRPDESNPNVHKVIPETISSDSEDGSDVTEAMKTEDPILITKDKEIKTKPDEVFSKIIPEQISSDSEDSNDVNEIVTEIQEIKSRPEASNHNYPKNIPAQISTDSEDDGDVTETMKTEDPKMITEIKSRPDDSNPNLSKIIPKEPLENLKCDGPLDKDCNVKNITEDAPVEHSDIDPKPETAKCLASSSDVNPIEVAISKPDEHSESNDNVSESNDVPIEVDEIMLDLPNPTAQKDHDQLISPEKSNTKPCIVSEIQEPEDESSTTEQISADDGTCSQSSADDILERQSSDNPTPVEEAYDKDLTKSDGGVVIRRDLKPSSDAKRESGVVLTSSEEEWSDSDETDTSGDSSGEYEVRRFDGLSEPLEVLEEETLLPGEFSDELSDCSSTQRKPADPLGEKSPPLSPELRQNMIPDGSDKGVVISEPESNIPVYAVNISMNNNNMIMSSINNDVDILDGDTKESLAMDDLHHLQKKLEESYAQSPDRIVKAAPMDVITPNNDNMQCNKDTEEVETDRGDKHDETEKDGRPESLSPPNQLAINSSSEESLVYHSAEEDITLYQTALQVNDSNSFTPTPMKFFSDIQAQSTPIKSLDETKPEIINEMVTYLPTCSQEVPDKEINPPKCDNVEEIPIHNEAVVVAELPVKDMINSIRETHNGDDFEKETQYTENTAKLLPDQIDEATKIASELQQLQQDVHQMSSMIHQYMLPIQDPNMVSLPSMPNNQPGLSSFDSPRFLTPAQLSPIPEEFLSRSTSCTNSNRSSPEITKLKPYDQSNSHIAIIVDSGSRSESDEDTEVDDRPQQAVASQVTLPRASYVDEEDFLFIPSSSTPQARAEQQPRHQQWQAESVVVKEELKPFIGQDFVATKAKMNLLLQVITGGRPGDDTESEEGSPPPRRPRPQSFEVLSSDNEIFEYEDLSKSLPIHLTSYADEPLIQKEAVMLEETPIIWPEVPPQLDAEIDVIQMTSTLNHKLKHIVVPLQEPHPKEELTRSDGLFKDWLAHHPVTEAPVNKSAVMVEEMPIKWPEKPETMDAETQMEYDDEDMDKQISYEVGDLVSNGSEKFAVETEGWEIDTCTSMSSSNTNVSHNNDLAGRGLKMPAGLIEDEQQKTKSVEIQVDIGKPIPLLNECAGESNSVQAIAPTSTWQKGDSELKTKDAETQILSDDEMHANLPQTNQVNAFIPQMADVVLRPNGDMFSIGINTSPVNILQEHAKESEMTKEAINDETTDPQVHLTEHIDVRTNTVGTNTPLKNLIVPIITKSEHKQVNTATNTSPVNVPLVKDNQEHDEGSDDEIRGILSNMVQNVVEKISIGTNTSPLTAMGISTRPVTCDVAVMTVCDVGVMTVMSDPISKTGSDLCDAGVMTIAPDPISQDGSDLIEEGLSITMKNSSTQVTPTAELEKLDVMDPILFQTNGYLFWEDTEDEDEDVYSNQGTLNSFIEDGYCKVSRSTSPMKFDHMHPADFSPRPRSPRKEQRFDLRQKSPKRKTKASDDKQDYFINSSSDDDKTVITELEDDDDEDVLLEKIRLRKRATELITKRAQDYAKQLRERTLNYSTSSSDESEVGDFIRDDYDNEADIESDHDSDTSSDKQLFEPQVTEIVLKELKMSEEVGAGLTDKLAQLEDSQRSYQMSHKSTSEMEATKSSSKSPIEPKFTTTLSKLFSSSGSETSDVTIVDKKEYHHRKSVSNLTSSPRWPQSEKVSSNTMPESRSKVLPVISEGLPKQRQCLPTFSDVSSFDSDYADDEDLQALKASGETIDRMMKEFPSFEEDDYPDTTEPELLALVDEDDRKANNLTPTPRDYPTSAPADISVVKYQSTGTPTEGGIAFQDTVPFDESVNANDLSDLRLHLSPLSPVKNEWLVVDLDDSLKKRSKNDGFSCHMKMSKDVSKGSEIKPNINPDFEDHDGYSPLLSSSGVFTASQPMTNPMMSSNNSDEDDLCDMHDAYKDLLEAPDSNLFGVSPTNACTQTDAETESIVLHATCTTTHDMSIETDRQMSHRSWNSPELESLRDDKDFVYSKIGNTLERRDVSVELMEAQMMHGMGEMDAMLKFMDSDLPVEEWYKQRRLAQEQQNTLVKNIVKKETVVREVSMTKVYSSHKTLSRRSSQDSTSVHSQSVSPRIFKTSADLDLSSVKRPSTQPATLSSGRTTPSQYRRFLQNLRKGIVTATATTEEGHSDVQSLLEESQMTRANSRAEIARAKMDLNNHSKHNGYDRPDDSADGRQMVSRSYSAPTGSDRNQAINNGIRRLSVEIEDAVDREIECMRAASAALSSSSDSLAEDHRPRSADMWRPKDVRRSSTTLPAYDNERSNCGNVPSLALEPPTLDAVNIPSSVNSTRNRHHQTSRQESPRTSLPISLHMAYNRYPYNKVNKNSPSTYSKRRTQSRSSSRSSSSNTSPVHSQSTNNSSKNSQEAAAKNSTDICNDNNNVRTINQPSQSLPDSPRSVEMLNRQNDSNTSNSQQMSPSRSASSITSSPSRSTSSSSQSPQRHQTHNQNENGSPTRKDHTSPTRSMSRSNSEDSPKRRPSPINGGYSPAGSEQNSSPSTSPALRRRRRNRSTDRITPDLPPLTESIANTSYSDIDYTGEQAVATLFTEMIQVGGFNPINKQHPKEYGGWRLQGQENGIILLQKTREINPIDSFMGISTIKAPARTVFGIIRDISQLKIFDSNLQDVKVLEDLTNRFKILHLLYTTDKCYLQKSRDVCIVFKEVKQNNKYVVAATSVQHQSCPDVEGVVRAEVLCCGIGLEPVKTPVGEHCKLMYLSQVDLKGELQAKLTNVIMKKQPLCIERIRKYIENKVTSK